MNKIMFLSLVISFNLSILVLPIWIKKCRQVGLLWEDMNKFGHPKNVASSGGIIVVLAFIFGVLSYIAVRTFAINDGVESLQIFSLLSVILILGLIGLTDDLLGWQHGGLSARLRVFLIFLAAIPLVVINAGHSTIMVPFFGVINIGVLYPLIVIPIGIIGATTTFNFLAGYNGLE